MAIESHRYLMAALLAASLAVTPAPAAAQAPPTAPTTAVMVNLTIKADVDRSQVLRVMPDEVRATVVLYLDGKIQQWYGRSDGRGVMFIMNCSTVADAKALMDELPLSKAHLANLEFTALGPLTPLHALLAASPSSAGKHHP